MSIRSTSFLSLLGLIAASGSAHAAFYSFASDNASTRPTFRGSSVVGTAPAIQIQDFDSANGSSNPGQLVNRFNLLIDDNNGPNPAITLNVGLKANLTASFAGQTGFFGSVNYNYAVSGFFAFTDPTNPNIDWLRVDINNVQQPALLTVTGTGGNNPSWGSAGAIIASDSFSNISYTLTAAGLAAFQSALAIAAPGVSTATYDIQGAGPAQGPNDFVFTLTRLGLLGPPGGGGNVALNPQTFLPNSPFQSESSFSGSSGVLVPTPGTMAILGLSGLVVSRRRRA